MRISELVEALTKVKIERGDIDVVTGFGMSGYGQEVTKVSLVKANSFSKASGEHDGPLIEAVDLISADESLIAE